MNFLFLLLFFIEEKFNQSFFCSVYFIFLLLKMFSPTVRHNFNTLTKQDRVNNEKRNCTPTTTQEYIFLYVLNFNFGFLKNLLSRVNASRVYVNSLCFLDGIFPYCSGFLEYNQILISLLSISPR